MVSDATLATSQACELGCSQLDILHTGQARHLPFRESSKCNVTQGASNYRRYCLMYRLVNTKGRDQNGNLPATHDRPSPAVQLRST